MLFADVKKAHLNPLCDQDVYLWLPDEAGKCGKLVHWLCGFRQAAQAWENHDAKKMEDVGFVRGVGTSVAFQYPERDLACAVHGDDFTFSGEDKDLDWAESLMKSWFQVVVRARLGARGEGRQGNFGVGSDREGGGLGFLLPGGSAT